MNKVVSKGEIHWTSQFHNLTFNKRWTNIYGGLKKFHDADIDFKILHNILFTNNKLFIFKMIDSPLCTLCNNEEETVFHLFIDCPEINSFWKRLIDKLNLLSM